MRYLALISAVVIGASIAIYRNGGIIAAVPELNKTVCLGDTCYRVHWRGSIAAVGGATSTLDEQQQWAYDLATRMGNPQPSAEILAFLVAWQKAEGTTAANNPLATSQDMPGATVFNSHGVKNYASRDDGLEATAITLGYNYPGYADIRDGILSNNPALALQGLYASPWGTDADNVRTLFENAPITSQEPPGTTNTRQRLVEYALSLQGTPYIVGGSESYRTGQTVEGGDCSATMQHIYAHVLGVNIGYNTWNQQDVLPSVDAGQLLPGDLWYGQFPSDQHTGMVADVDGDGRWDLIHNGADENRLHVTYDFGNTYLGEHTIGYRRAL